MAAPPNAHERTCHAYVEAAVRARLEVRHRCVDCREEHRFRITKAHIRWDGPTKAFFVLKMEPIEGQAGCRARQYDYLIDETSDEARVQTLLAEAGLLVSRAAIGSWTEDQIEHALVFADALMTNHPIGEGLRALPIPAHLAVEYARMRRLG
jgi:hypothetical protein